MTKQEFLAFSLPYGLIINFDKYEEITDKMVGMEIGTDNEWCCYYEEFGEVNSVDVKPILRPLSDLTKPIVHKGEEFVPMKEIAIYNPNNVEYLIECVVTGLVEYIVLRQLIEWHFDIADLISKGEAIDVNTLPENPYK